MDQDLPERPNAGEPGQKGEAFTPGIACICFFAVTLILFYAYGHLHWGLLREHYAALEKPVKEKLFRLLGFLEVYHATALLALCFGLRTFWTRPLWIRWVCLPVMVFSSLLLFSFM
jgi:hypothetical protein